LPRAAAVQPLVFLAVGLVTAARMALILLAVGVTAAGTRLPVKLTQRIVQYNLYFIVSLKVCNRVTMQGLFMRLRVGLIIGDSACARQGSCASLLQ
jgi:hypothetical protein